MTEFTIEKGVPIPEEVGRFKYPFLQMEIGDSFFVEGRTSGQLANNTSAAKRKGMKFIMRATVEDNKSGTRVWRKE